jgi:hypothetical protein
LIECLVIGNHTAEKKEREKESGKTKNEKGKKNSTNSDYKWKQRGIKRQRRAGDQRHNNLTPAPLQSPSLSLSFLSV